MGQKVHPIGIRLGISKDWNSTWYAEKGEYAEMLNSDLAVRAYLQKRLQQAAVSRIQIERPAKTARITIHTARPGIVIGKKGEDIERLRREVTARMGVPTHISVAEIRKPELDAQLVAEGIAQQLGTPYYVPPCNEACGWQFNAPGCTGYQGKAFGPFERC